MVRTPIRTRGNTHRSACSALKCRPRWGIIEGSSVLWPARSSLTSTLPVLVPGVTEWWNGTESQTPDWAPPESIKHLHVQTSLHSHYVFPLTRSLLHFQNPLTYILTPSSPICTANHCTPHSAPPLTTHLRHLHFSSLPLLCVIETQPVEDQDSGWLLLLHLWRSRIPEWPRCLFHQHGPSHGESNFVSKPIFYKEPVVHIMIASLPWKAVHLYSCHQDIIFITPKFVVKQIIWIT